LEGNFQQISMTDILLVVVQAGAVNLLLMANLFGWLGFISLPRSLLMHGPESRERGTARLTFHPLPKAATVSGMP
jgi:hypothetical protein